MRVVHEAGEESNVLATDVKLVTTLLSQGIGLMGRSELPENYAMYFDFGRVRSRGVHMLFVRTPLDVVWTVENRVRRVETLDAWTGHARARADAFVELPAGAANDVGRGDTVRLEEGT